MQRYQADRRRSSREPCRFESLESRLLLTRSLTLAEPVALVTADAGFAIGASEFVELDGDRERELVVLQVRPGELTRLSVFDALLPGRYELVGQSLLSVELEGMVVSDALADGSIDLAVWDREGQMQMLNLKQDVPGVRITEPRIVQVDPVGYMAKVFLADLNSDGQSDLVWTHLVSELNVRLSDGLGGLNEPTRYSGRAHALGDFDEDGTLDLIVNGGREVLLNDGTGVFEAAPETNAAFGLGVISADFDRDGQLDLVASDFNGMSVLWGDGDATFAEPELFVATNPAWFNDSGIQEFHNADIDGDGYLDVFLGIEDAIHGGVLPPRIAYGTETGFETTSYPERWPWWSAIPTNVDGDARSEFVVKSANAISVIRQVETVAFDITTEDRPNHFRHLVDVNRDGMEDVLLLDGSVLTILELKEGERIYDGFEVELGVPIEKVHNIIRLEDAPHASLGGDGLLMIARSVDGDDLLVHLQRDANAWHADVEVLSGRLVCGDVAELSCVVVPVDLNVDGRGELLLAFTNAFASVGFEAAGLRVRTTIELESDVFAGFSTFPDGEPIFESRDMDDDGLQDIVFSYPVDDGFAWQVAFNRTDSDWLISDVIRNANRFFPDYVDMNGDGVLDFVHGAERDRTEVALLSSVGKWSLWDELDYIGKPLDLNADGVLDLFGTHGTKGVQVDLANGDGTWDSAMEPNRYASAGAAGDFNEDGIHEILVQRSALRVYDFMGDTTISSSPKLAVVGIARDFTFSVSDEDRDGHLDVVAVPDAFQSTCGVSYRYFGDGTGTFPITSEFETPCPPSELPGQFVELDGDGIPERFVGGSILKQIDGEWQQVALSPFFRRDVGEVESAYVDDDDILDLVIRGPYREEHGQWVLFGEGEFEFRRPVLISGRQFKRGFLFDDVGATHAVTALNKNESNVDYVTHMFLDSREGLLVGDRVVLLSEEGVTFVSRRDTGDFNGDGMSDSSDIDELFAHLGGSEVSSRRYDLNHDLQVDQLDVDFWLKHSADTQRGDVDLSGSVDFDDFLKLSANFGSMDATWSDGDFDGGGEVDFEDYLALSANFGSEHELD